MVMSAATLRKKQVPPWQTAKVQAKINVPLKLAKSETSQANLLIQAAAGKQDPTKGTFLLHWGNNKLTASLIANLDGTKPSPTSKRSGKGK